MAPALNPEDFETKPKGSSKRNKRKRQEATNANKPNNINNNSKESNGENSIQLLTTITIKRDLQEQQQDFQQYRETNGEQEAQPQMQQDEVFEDEDENILNDLEQELMQIKLEQILEPTNGRADFVFVNVYIKPVNKDNDVPYIYLTEGNSNKTNKASATFCVNDKKVVHVPIKRRTLSDHQARIRSTTAALQASEILLNYRIQVYLELIIFYKKFLSLNRRGFERLSGRREFWQQLYLSEKFINQTSRFRFQTLKNSPFPQENINPIKKKGNMVHEIGGQTAMSQEGIVNSVSLEDVPLSESSDMRAQSIQSLHSAVDTPTPDSTPSYDELQQRLDEYNRHIEHMNEQKNQLLRMHNDAKRHLLLLEQYQRQCGENNLSFDDRMKNGTTNGGGQPPNYESVQEVETDMAILAGRVNKMTELVNSQRGLMGQLKGADADEMRADQEQLEEKLRGIRKNGDDIRGIASELDTLNVNATRATGARAKVEKQSSPTNSDRSETPTITDGVADRDTARIVPIRVANSGNETASAKSIEQKEAEIETMKTQLQRLKNMMSTIESIESNASKAVNTRKIPSMAMADHVETEDPIRNDRDRTPIPNNGTMSRADVERNLRKLQGVSSDMRTQGERMVAEKERIRALQDEISRCSQQAAAAAQLGEDALKRHSITPTPTSASASASTPQNYQQPNNVDSGIVSSKSNDDLELEYEAKKQDYWEMCRRLEELGAIDQKSDCRQHRKQSGALETVPSDVNNANNIVSNVNMNDNTSADASSVGSATHSMPPSMANMSGGVNWATTPHSWSYPNFRCPIPSSVLSPSCGILPSSAFLSTQTLPPAPSNNEQQVYFNNISNNPASGGNGQQGNPNAPNLQDHNMMQQIHQHQQVFAQVLNQLNNMMWTHQRDIDQLNRMVQMLNDRVYRIGGDAIILPTDFGAGIRSESVPPLPLPPASINAFPTAFHRAQSEQPTPFAVEGSFIGNGLPFLHQQQHHFVQQQQQQQQVHHHQRQFSMNGTISNILNGIAGAYRETAQQHQQHVAAASATNSSANNAVYPTLNNASVSGRAPPQPAGHEAAGPAPIFMHHHNNSIHQNNANLRRANVHANGSGGSFNANLGTGGAVDSNNTLNNQVPPGIRANNYWDNFRSYSRQNLFSTNTNKSNEGNQQHQQQQPQLQSQELQNYDYDVEVGEYYQDGPSFHDEALRRRRRRRPPPPQNEQQRQRLPLNEVNQPNAINNIADGGGAGNVSSSGRNTGARIKNFQQNRNQQPHPLPTGSIITNPLHTNVQPGEAVTNGRSDSTETASNELSDEHWLFSTPPLPNIDDRFTAEMYGCNYEQHPTATTSSYGGHNASNERNINYGNSPRNRQGHDKVATKFQYPMRPEQPNQRRGQQQRQEHPESRPPVGFDLRREQGNYGFTQQHLQLQLHLHRQHPRRVMPQQLREIRVQPQQQRHREEEEDDEPELRQIEILQQQQIDLKPQPRRIRDYTETPSTPISDEVAEYEDEDVVNGGGGARYASSMINKLFSNERVGNHFSRNSPLQKRADPDIASSPQSPQSLPSTNPFLINYDDTRSPDATDQQNRAAEETYATLERRSSPDERYSKSSNNNRNGLEDQSSTSDVSNDETLQPTISRSQSDNNIMLSNAEEQLVIVKPQRTFNFRTCSAPNLENGTPLEGADRRMMEEIKEQDTQSTTKQDKLQKENKQQQQQQQIRPNGRLSSSEQSNTGNRDYSQSDSASSAHQSNGASSQNYEDIDFMGACSLAAQQHIRNETQRALSPPKEASVLKESSFNESSTQEKADDDDATSNEPNPFSTENWSAAIAKYRAPLDATSRDLIDIIISSIRSDMRSVPFIDDLTLEMVVKITATICQSALLNREFPQGDVCLLLLSPTKLLTSIRHNIRSIPIRLSEYLVWFEKYLKMLLIHSAAEEAWRNSGSRNEFHHLIRAIEIDEYNRGRNGDSPTHPYTEHSRTQAVTRFTEDILEMAAKDENNEPPATEYVDPSQNVVDNADAAPATERPNDVAAEKCDGEPKKKQQPQDVHGHKHQKHNRRNRRGHGKKNSRW